MKEEWLNLLVAVNNDYFMPTRVMFHSFLAHNNCPVRLFVMFRELNQTAKALLNADAEKSGHAKVEWIHVTEEDPCAPPLRCPWITGETYFRLFAAQLLPPDVERVLYLDGDLVIRGDLEEFYHQDLEGNLMAACRCELGSETTKYNRLCQGIFPEDVVYFNAGVLLFDLKAQREKLAPDLYRQIADGFGDRLLLGDQDILNLAFYRQVRICESRRFNLEEFTLGEEEALPDETLILHWCGSRKPWKFSYVRPFGDEFWKYAADFPEYRVLQAGIREAQKQYSLYLQQQQSSKQKTEQMQEEYRMNEEAEKAAKRCPEHFAEDAVLCLKEGTRLIRTGKINMVALSPELQRDYSGHLRLTETGAYLYQLLKHPITRAELMKDLARDGDISEQAAGAIVNGFIRMLANCYLLKSCQV